MQSQGSGSLFHGLNMPDLDCSIFIRQDLSLLSNKILYIYFQLISSVFLQYYFLKRKCIYLHTTFSMLKLHLLIVNDTQGGKNHCILPNQRIFYATILYIFVKSSHNYFSLLSAWIIHPFFFLDIIASYWPLLHVLQNKRLLSPNAVVLLFKHFQRNVTQCHFHKHYIQP